MTMIKTLNTIKSNVFGTIQPDRMAEDFIHLNDVLSEKDTYTHGHCKRVTYYCSLIGNKLMLSTKRMEILLLGAFFHDIGKISIPNKILKKPGRLNKLERKIIQSHPKISAKLLQMAGCPKDVVSSMLYHHERPDGFGYPFGLNEKNIPLHSKIVSVADSFDAMTSRRCYSDVLETSEALNELYNSKGTQFDPHIVDVFTKIINGQDVMLAAV
jgi:putative nucleotidyltransferase with HDIG domain